MVYEKKLSLTFIWTGKGKGVFMRSLLYGNPFPTFISCALVEFRGPFRYLGREFAIRVYNVYICIDLGIGPANINIY